MKQIALLVYEEVMLPAVANTFSMLKSAGEATWKRTGTRPFDIEMVSVGANKVQLSLPVELHCARSIAEVHEADVVVIPPMDVISNDVAALLARNDQLLGWIRQQYQQQAQFISLCTGAYFLAETGLLNGKPATSHWGVMEDLQRKYPLVHFKPGNVFTHAGSIITGGGGFSSLNALLYFIEMACSKEVAVELSKVYALDYGRSTQANFSIFSGQRKHNDEEIHKSQRYIEEMFRYELSVDQVAQEVNMSRRNFIRRFKQATALSPIDYIHQVKVEAAKRAFESGNMNIAAVTYDVGYNDLKTFRMVFKRITGLTPLEYRNKFNSSRSFIKQH